MQLYFFPLACSLATRIALAEAKTDATFVEVDPLTKTLIEGGRDYHEINPLGLVPALRMDNGEILTENIAVLQHVAQKSGLAPDDELGRARLNQWLGFISTELHTRVFSAMFDPATPPAAREHAVQKSTKRLALLDAHLTEREHLLNRFTVADAYLITVLNWAQATPVDLAPWPALQRYLSRGLERPSVKQSIAIELPLYLAERARAKARTDAQAQPATAKR